MQQYIIVDNVVRQPQIPHLTKSETQKCKIKPSDRVNNQEAIRKEMKVVG